jgi:hypothetical protein
MVEQNSRLRMLIYEYIILHFYRYCPITIFIKSSCQFVFKKSTPEALIKRNQFLSFDREYRHCRKSEIFSKGHLESYCINKYSIKCLQNSSANEQWISITHLLHLKGRWPFNFISQELYPNFIPFLRLLPLLLLSLRKCIITLFKYQINFNLTHQKAILHILLDWNPLIHESHSEPWSFFNTRENLGDMVPTSSYLII